MAQFSEETVKEVIDLEMKKKALDRSFSRLRTKNTKKKISNIIERNLIQKKLKAIYQEI